jgi:hypothetical protein
MNAGRTVFAQLISGQWSVKRRIGFNTEATEGAEFAETEGEAKYEELPGPPPLGFL